MKIRVLGCSGAEFPGYHPSAFLVDDALLLDAGTIGAVLSALEQETLKWVLITHAHLDHVRGIPLLADNMIVDNKGGSIQVMGIPETLRALREHLMNGVIWPDFSLIPTPEQAIVRYYPLEPEREYLINGYRVTAYPVNHSVPAVAYRVSQGGVSILYSGDTGPTERIWEAAGTLDALIIEISFPDEQEELAIRAGHLTPRLLLNELRKLPSPPGRILITHMKPQHAMKIREQLYVLGIRQCEFMRDGAVYRIPAEQG
jgi:ribonuclease BN (tRNA processing enzyme)